MLKQLKLIHLHQKLGDDEAVTAYNKAIELNSRYSDAWSNKGNAPCQGRFDKALKVYEYAISIDSNDSEVRNKKNTLLKQIK